MHCDGGGIAGWIAVYGCLCIWHYVLGVGGSLNLRVLVTAEEISGLLSSSRKRLLLLSYSAMITSQAHH